MSEENAALVRRIYEEKWIDDDLDRLFELADPEIVVASVSWHTISRGSETELVQEEVHSWTLREGRITRFEWGRDLEAALEAARQG